MNCSKVKKRISLFYDDRLDRRESQAVEEHLSRCPSCNTDYQQLSLACRLAGALPHQAPSSDGWENLQSRLATPETPWQPARQPVFRFAFATGIALFAGLAALGLFWHSQSGVQVVDERPTVVYNQRSVDNLTSESNNPEGTNPVSAGSEEPMNQADSRHQPKQTLKSAGPVPQQATPGKRQGQNRTVHQPQPHNQTVQDSLHISGHEAAFSLEPDPEFSEPETVALYGDTDLLDLVDEGLDPLVSAASLYSDPLDWLIVLNDQEWL